MLGMRKLSSSYLDDQRLGLKLLRFSNEAMQHLERKRNVALKTSRLATVIMDRGMP